MDIPDYESIMLPMLQLLSDNNLHELKDIYELLGDHFKLPEEKKTEIYPSGNGIIFQHRIRFAKLYMQRAGLIETPKEQIEDAYQILRNELTSELLSQIQNSSPSFFEKLVVDLIIAMGYGGSRRDAGKAIGRSRDGGIDGIINEDKLGLDVIYIQAKRWNKNKVRSKEISEFSGSIGRKKANKGIFITTSTFTKDALQAAQEADKKLKLIDGEKLANLMIEFGVGIKNLENYQLKQVDSDYFEN